MRYFRLLCFPRKHCFLNWFREFTVRDSHIRRPLLLRDIYFGESYLIFRHKWLDSKRGKEKFAMCPFWPHGAMKGGGRIPDCCLTPATRWCCRSGTGLFLHPGSVLSQCGMCVYSLWSMDNAFLLPFIRISLHWGIEYDNYKWFFAC